MFIRTRAHRRTSIAAVGVLLAAGLVGSLLAMSSQAATRVSSFSATADARVEKSASTSNFGTATRLISDDSPVIESFFRFTVSGVSGTVERAKLRVYVYNGSINGPAVYTTGTSWTETTINYSMPTGPLAPVLPSRTRQASRVGRGWSTT